MLPPCPVRRAVVERHFDLVGSFDDVIIGQNIALTADDDAGTQAGGTLAGFGAAAEEIAEQRIVDQRVARLTDFLRGVHMHHRRQGVACGIPVRQAGHGLATGCRRLAQGDDLLLLAGRFCQPFGPERADDKKDGKTDRDGLCENQPESMHTKDATHETRRTDALP